MVVGAVYPGRRFGAKLINPANGEPFRKQEMPMNVTCHYIAQYVGAGGVILDPFAGTGVVGLAALRTGHPCVM